MTIKIKKTNLKRLASLSALGAGALGLTAGPANASSIVYSGIVDEKVGFAAGYGSQATIAGPNGAAGFFMRSSWVACSSQCLGMHNIDVLAHAGPQGTDFRFAVIPYFPFSASAFPLNAGFSPPATARLRSFGYIAQSWCNYLSHCSTGGLNAVSQFNPTDRYLLFEFAGGSLQQPLYGWAQLNVSLPGNVTGPNVTLVDWAYDLSGAEIRAGDTGTPEPPTALLTGLAALALGAQGLRNWRAARMRA